MRKHPILLAIGTALIFVGAGCGARQQTSTDLDLKMPPKAGTELEADVKMEANEGSVDAAVEATVEGMMEEQEAQQEAEADASQLEADKAEINAYGEGSYELK